MDDKIFVLLSNQFKRERDGLKEALQKSTQNVRPPRHFRTVSHVEGSRRPNNNKVFKVDIVR